MVHNIYRYVYGFDYRAAFVVSRRQAPRAGTTLRAKPIGHSHIFKTACVQQRREDASGECVKDIREKTQCLATLQNIVVHTTKAHVRRRKKSENLYFIDW